MSKENIVENIIAFAIVIFVIAGIAWLATRPAEQPDTRVSLSPGVSPTLGNQDAPVTVVMFSDFECPFCAQFALGSFPEIRARYIDTGQVLFAYKHFPLTQVHGHALLAAQAAACAYDQDAFWEYHDVLYAHQDALEIGNLEEYAAQLGIDGESFRQCLIQEQRKDEVLRDKDTGIRSGVTGTPTFFFNGRRVVGSLTAEEFGAEVADELA